MLTLFEIFGAVFLFIRCGNGVPAVFAGVLDIPKFDKNPLTYNVSKFDLGTCKFVWWGLSLPKPLVATELVAKRHHSYVKNCINKPCQIHQNESNTFYKLFLLKRLFLWLQMLVYRWTKGTSTKLTLPTVWLWFTLLAVQTHNLSSKLATHTHQLHYPLQERHFRTSLRHAEKQQLHWNWAMFLCRVLHFNRQNLMLITPPNDQATTYGTYWKYHPEH